MIKKQNHFFHSTSPFLILRICLSSMAALSVVRSFHGSHGSIQDLKTRNCPRILILLSCQRGEPTDTSSSKEKKERKQDKQLVRQIFGSVENFGKGLKDSLSPKQKGDWKDVMLMSLSFAVYVYMSQKIVCAYCAWVSKLKQW